MKKFLLLLLISNIIYCQGTSNWVTHFEKSNFLSTPRYIESMKYFESIADLSPFAIFQSFGVSPQGRSLNYIIVSSEKTFDPVSAKAAGKPVLLIVNGIHSGEIGGKDASMLLLRDILVSKEKLDLIKNVVLIVVPIFNVDGHERMGKYNRINQNGPEEMGWRTTSQNLNLNRDWLKADTPEMKAMIKLFSKWMPDFIIDTHCTDGADYQYTITYSVEKFANIYQGTADWLKQKYIPFLENGVNKKGFLVHPYVYLKEWKRGIEGGLMDWAATPRFSTGYAALQNRPSLLIETHMIKPYKERVYSTKAMIETTLEFLNNHSDELVELNREADRNSLEYFVKKKSYLPISFKSSKKFKEINFKGFGYHWESSDISGTDKLVYTNEKKNYKVQYFNDVVPNDSVQVPAGYLIPVEWQNLVERLKLHGVKADVIRNDTIINVRRYKFSNVKFDKSPFESKHRVSFEIGEFRTSMEVEGGTYFVSTNQIPFRVVVNLLEPKAPDSFIKWGFMNQVFEQKEYFETYVMEKIASKMINNDPKLKREFQNKLKTDEEFKKNPQARLNFFYERSPYYDERLRVYPIAIVE